MKKCTWCEKEMVVVHCDYWSEKNQKYMLELCSDCYEKRFNYEHKIVILKSLLEKFIRDNL